jgi:hypothetical protein
MNRTWRKSSYSGGQGNCVEVSTDDASTVAVRDSKNVPGPELAVSPDAWVTFVEAIKHGAFEVN